MCRVAFETTTPPTVTGSRLATGVSAPVRPTWMVISLITVVACSAANLCAIAQRGARPTKAEPSLQIDAVDLQHDPIDIVRERVAFGSDCP